jgi:hypothetical protein
VGGHVFWKLYAIENLLRVLVNSILAAQIGKDWWDLAVDPAIINSVARRKKDYEQSPWHSSPGGHNIYFAFLSDLGKIMLSNSHLFLPNVSNTDAWIARIEQVRVPRNVVGHMNWPSSIDRKRIDVFHADIHMLLGHLSKQGYPLKIP